MMFQSILTGLLAMSTGGFANASPMEEREVNSGSTLTRCYTDKGPHSKKQVPTFYKTITTSCTNTAHTTISITSTPPAQTTTVIKKTTTTFTAPTSVLTSTVTTTDTESTHVTTDFTSTTTSIETTTAASTSTIPTTEGFLPVQSSLPGSTYDPSLADGGPDPVGGSKRGLDVKHPNNVTRAVKKPSYPQEVKCYKYVPGHCSTTTATSTVTTVLPTPKSKTIKTRTITKTYAPSATTTITSTDTTTTTSTETNTIVSTTTSTSTEISSTTVYEACATNNFANEYQGSGLIYAHSPQSGSFVAYSGTTAYDCCVGAIDNPTPGQVWGFAGASFAPEECFTFTAGASCPDGQSSALFTVDGYSFRNTYGNGYCGEINSFSASSS